MINENGNSNIYFKMPKIKYGHEYLVVNYKKPSQYNTYVAQWKKDDLLKIL